MNVVFLLAKIDLHPAPEVVTEPRVNVVIEQEIGALDAVIRCGGVAPIRRRVHLEGSRRI